MFIRLNFQLIQKKELNIYGKPFYFTSQRNTNERTLLNLNKYGQKSYLNRLN